ncbi:kinase-like domain-containing protein [Blakeslea trispora]|nr:kinase-like domain-containing protein [Blakeslea trispora]
MTSAQQTPSSIASPTIPTSPSPTRTQQRAHSVTSMPSELQKSAMRHQEVEHQEKMRHNQPWWQYYYQLYHYQLPPGRKPTVFGPYLLLQTLGEGEFGKVKFGIEVKTGQEVAIKLIRKDNIDSTSRMTKVEREISVLRILHHPNIVELFDVIETEKYIGIILQCATGGELFDYILAHRYLKEKDASRLFAQLISGVHYMHQKRIVHRDLKLENLLLDKHRNVLITDFGFANQFSSAQDDLMSTSCGSPCYAAPELVMNQGVYVGPAVDIWSCGVILFAMLCGYLPYDDDPANPESYNINLLYKYILNTPLIFPDYISKEACHLMSLMLVPDPEKRCSMEAIMAHPWLSAHQHLFVQVKDNIAKEQDQEQKEPMDEAVVPEITPSITEQEDEATVPDPPEDQEMKDTPMEEAAPKEDVEVPPVIVEKKEVHQKTVETPKPETPKPETSVSKTPKPTTNTKVRPKSTASASTGKVLNFLSGQSNTPKPTSRSTNDKRTRHMSLASSSEPPSILQSKFLSSLQQQRKQTPPPPPSPLPSASSPSPNASASTPHPAKKQQKRTARLSTHTPPTTANERGTRRKTLSLLVNSMTDNRMPFSQHRRQSNSKPHQEGEKEEPDAIPVVPSVSEHVLNVLSEKEEKQKSTGKKLMDWFKKKPLSTIQKSNQLGQDTAISSAQTSPSTAQYEPKLRIHHGAVDQEALTSRHPGQVFAEVKQTLKSLGLEYKRDGSEFKLKCSRPKRSAAEKRKSAQRTLHAPPLQPPQHHHGGAPFRMLLRRASASQASTESDKPATIYGDPNVDPGEEVRFSVELCKIKNLPGLYIVDMRRMRGNVWAYKFIYRTLLDTLKLGGKSEYLKTNPPAASKKTRPKETKKGSIVENTEDKNQFRTSTTTNSSGGNSSSVLLDDVPTANNSSSSSINHSTTELKKTVA